MKAVTLLSRHFSTVKQIQTLVSPIRNNTVLTEDSCFQILELYPDIKTLKNLHAKIIIDPQLHSNPSIGFKLMRAYAARGETGLTRHVFDEITDKNVVFFNVMIRSYANNHLFSDALLVFKTMSNCGFELDNYTYPWLLKACSGLNSLWVGLQIHGAVVKVGLDSNLFIRNGLVSMYGKCGCLVEARRVLDEMPSRDVVSWNSMVARYAQSGRFDDALEICREMESLRLKLDAGTMASLLPYVTNTSSENVLYVKEMFSNLAKKILVSWNVMIAVYVNSSMPTEAIDLYSQMGVQGIEPDAISVASVHPACGDLSALLLGRQIHQDVERNKLRPNLLLENALIDMYAKCGSLAEARAVFEGMQFGMLCDGLLCSLLTEWVGKVAMHHSRLLEEGRYNFKLMTERYKIIPRIEHFACLVDLVGRAGKVEEAYSIIRQMPMEPNERVWGVLLGACHVYSNMDIGLLAADHLFRLAPEQLGYYVLLSNIYAKAGRWDDVMTVRSIMKRKGLKKMPSASNIEINGRVYTFLAGDQSHAQSKKIYEELDVLVGKMKEAGYVPETDSAK
ncbi:hypothetical protein EZV62_006011 [Acer yangbiense]|uniref:Uncharacterized protein n=1 Tax=Acer yangbiense TaxID=1000413 RepID=A0A5C7IRJ8_9ROSI|nr:hypothetical protein EZV62_006011 [Acer yangbiense]